VSRAGAEAVQRRAILALVGLTFSGLCLWLAVRHIDWREVRAIIASVEVSWIALAVGLQGVNLLLRGRRWRELLLFAAPARPGSVLDALLVGYAVNSALPARLGELFRADRLARTTRASRSTALASIIVERLLDLVTAVSLLLAGLLLAGSATSAARHAVIVGAVLVLAVAGLLSVMAWRFAPGMGETLVSRLVHRLRRGNDIASLLGPMADDFASFARVLHSRRFLVAAAMTLPIWAIETGAIWSICRAVRVELGIDGLLYLMGGASLSTVLPAAPGFIGSYQYAYVLIFGQFGLGAASAVVAATAAQVFLIGTYTIVGLALLALSPVVVGHART
jgi:uncharacterized protein (TIRG00374 family)